MYCPVDGVEYRDGISRCPEHDVALVDEPPEAEEPAPWTTRVAFEGFAGWAAVVVALAGIVYAVAGTFYGLLATLGPDRQFGDSPTGAIAVAGLVQSAAWAIGLGAFGGLAAAVLARTYTRLARPPAEPYDDEDEDDEVLPPERGEWFMPLVSTLTICFALVWMGLAVAIAWKTRDLAEEFAFDSSVSGLGDLYAYQSAAAACTLGSLVVMGALLMGRAHDRLSGSR